jgi:hypothetical protein
VSRFRRGLRWLHVEDRSGKLSLTTVAFAVACYCLVKGQGGVSIEQLGVFTVAVAAHRHRQSQDQIAPVAAEESKP